MLLAPVALVVAFRQWLELKDGVCVCVAAGGWPSISLHLVSELHCGFSLLGLVWAFLQLGSSPCLLMAQGSTMRVLEKPAEAGLPFLT